MDISLDTLNQHSMFLKIRNEDLAICKFTLSHSFSRRLNNHSVSISYSNNHFKTTLLQIIVFSRLLKTESTASWILHTV